MTSHEEFFRLQQPAAVLKHALLEEYTKVFASAVGSQDLTRPVWVIDGYAGAGAYEEPDPEGAHPDGSPLVVLKMADGFSHTRTIKAIFIESNASAVAALKENITPYLERGIDASVLQGTVEEQLPAAWTMVGGDPVVTFLDPFGVAMGRDMMTDFLLVKARRKPSEVLLNINIEAVRRIGGNLELVGGRVMPRAGQEKGVERVDRFFGGTNWRKTFLDVRMTHGSAAKAAEQVIAQYRHQIKANTGYDSMSIPVRRRPNNEPLFLLTLFFKHSFAGYKFADAACRATKKWRQADRLRHLDDYLGKQSQDSLFGDGFEFESSRKNWEGKEKQLDAEWVAQICSNVRELGIARLQVAANIDQILGPTLGLAGERHIRRAWDQLAKEGYLFPRTKGNGVKIHEATMERA